MKPLPTPVTLDFHRNEFRDDADAESKVYFERARTAKELLLSMTWSYRHESGYDDAEAYRAGVRSHAASSPSPRGLPVAVLYRDGALLWDPHPDGGGVVFLFTVVPSQSRQIKEAAPPVTRV